MLAWLLALDAQVFQRIYGRDPGAFTTLMLVFTWLGNGVNLFALVPFLAHARTRRFAAWLVATLAAAALVVFTLKAIVQRGRPVTVFSHVRAVALDSPTDFSFPSGHAAGSFCFALFMSRLFFAGLLPRRGAWLASTGLVLAAFAVGLSRIVLGFHYPLDVTAGALLGGTLGAVSGSRYVRRVPAVIDDPDA